MGPGFSEGIGKVLVTGMIIIAIVAFLVGGGLTWLGNWWFSSSDGEVISEALGSYCSNHEDIRTQRSASCELKVRITFTDGTPKAYEVLE